MAKHRRKLTLFGVTSALALAVAALIVAPGRRRERGHGHPESGAGQHVGAHRQPVDPAMREGQQLE